MPVPILPDINLWTPSSPRKIVIISAVVFFMKKSLLSFCEIPLHFFTVAGKYVNHLFGKLYIPYFCFSIRLSCLIVCSLNSILNYFIVSYFSQYYQTHHFFHNFKYYIIYCKSCHHFFDKNNRKTFSVRCRAIQTRP